MYEFYILIKHANFSYGDILQMPICERRGFIDILIEENEKAKAEREKALAAAKSRK